MSEHIRIADVTVCIVNDDIARASLCQRYARAQEAKVNIATID